MCRQKWKQTTGRVGVVVITIASHAIGRGFNPRIRYYSLFLPLLHPNQQTKITSVQETEQFEYERMILIHASNTLMDCSHLSVYSA